MERRSQTQTACSTPTLDARTGTDLITARWASRIHFGRTCTALAAFGALVLGCASTQSGPTADSPRGPRPVTSRLASAALVPDVVSSAAVAPAPEPAAPAYPPCSTVAPQGIACRGTLDGVRGCRYQAERKCGTDNSKILCLDSTGPSEQVTVRYECKTHVAQQRRARKSSMGLCGSDRDCAAGPGWEEVCFSTLISPTPTHGQCGDLRQGVQGEDRSIASATVTEPMCSDAKPCGSGERCIRLLSSRTNVCVTMQ